MMTLQLRVLLLKDSSDAWSAQCLEHDIAAQGATTREALSQLSRTIAGELALRAKDGIEGLDDIPPAPDMYWELFDESDSLNATPPPQYRPDENETLQKAAFMVPKFHECRVA